MKIRLMLSMVLACIALPVAAEFQTVAEAHELALSDVRVPVSLSGTIVFKTCVDCDALVIAVTPNTEYRINSKTYPLKEFRKRVFDIRDRSETAVTVLHHLETDVVLSVSVYE